MEPDTMNCEKCGGIMNKLDETTMQCESCGEIKKMDNPKEEEK